MSKYTWVDTGDGSPSLQIEMTGAVDRSEKMHSWEGAFSETQYVYGETIRMATKEGGSLRVFSLGLGLGYNEILAAAEVASQNLQLDYGVSTEIDPWLIQQFRSWVNLGPSELQVPYDKILNLFANHYSLNSKQIRELLRDWLENNKWQLLGGYRLGFDFENKKFNVILYDAFSDKISPELWSQEIIDQTLLASDSSCVFGTYASKGILKRSLKSHGFMILDRAGYGGKKESTLAVKKGS
jgi:hypothetical protein